MRAWLICLILGIFGVTAAFASSITGLSSIIVGSHRVWVPASGGIEWAGLSLEPFYGKSNHLAERLFDKQFPGAATISIWNPTSQMYSSVQRNSRGVWIPTNFALNRGQGLSINNQSSSPTSGVTLLITGIVPSHPNTNSSSATITSTNIFLLTPLYPVAKKWGDYPIVPSAGTNAQMYMWDVENQTYDLRVTNTAAGWGDATNIIMSPGRGFWIKGGYGVTQTWNEAKPYTWP